MPHLVEERGDREPALLPESDEELTLLRLQLLPVWSATLSEKMGSSSSDQRAALLTAADGSGIAARGEEGNDCGSVRKQVQALVRPEGVEGQEARPRLALLTCGIGQQDAEAASSCSSDRRGGEGGAKAAESRSSSRSVDSSGENREDSLETADQEEDGKPPASSSHGRGSGRQAVADGELQPASHGWEEQ